MDCVEPASINGREYPIDIVLTANRTASAKLKGGRIVVGIPARWPERERAKSAESLIRRAVKAIRDGRWRPAMAPRLAFRDRQVLCALGRRFHIALTHSGRFGVTVDGERVNAHIDRNHPDSGGKASAMIWKAIARSLMPALRARVDALNAAHFGSEIRRITVRDNSSRWGSCSINGSISLNARLLFMPGPVLDYVIIHELAHTRYRSHGKRFWALVEKAVPDHREKRCWLRTHGWNEPDSFASIPGSDERAAPDPGGPAESLEEPY